MIKYFYVFKLNFLTAMHFRFDSVFGLFMGNVGTLITMIFWLVIFNSSGNGELNGYSSNDIVTFFVVSGLFSGMILSGGGFELSGLIKRGGLSQMLLRPYNISLHLYWKNLSGAGHGFINQSILLLIVVPFFKDYLTWELSLVSSIFLVAYMIVATVISFQVWILFGKLAFWMEQSTAVMYSFAVILNFLSGMFMPLDFFPKWSISFLEIFPFSAFTYIPAKIYMNHLSPSRVIVLLMVHVGWIGILAVINSIVWKKGVKKYTAVGG